VFSAIKERMENLRQKRQLEKSKLMSTAWQHLIIKESLKYLKTMRANIRSEQNDKIPATAPIPLVLVR
jgi:hypothetical protein